jgi:hypothetical protein
VLTFFLSVLSLTSCFECVVTHLFECVLTLITDRLAAHFCKGPSSTSVKTFCNISAQPQLLEVEGPGDVGIVKTGLCYILCSCFIFIFLIFLWLIYSCENLIDLNCIPLPLHLNIKSQIGLYISTLSSLHSCTILTFQYHHRRAFKSLLLIYFCEELVSYNVHIEVLIRKSHNKHNLKYLYEFAWIYAHFQGQKWWKT